MIETTAKVLFTGVLLLDILFIRRKKSLHNFKLQFKSFYKIQNIHNGQYILTKVEISALDIFNCDDKEQHFTVTLFGVASLACGIWKFTLRVGGRGQTENDPE